MDLSQGLRSSGSDMVADKIEERTALGITDSLGAGFVSFGETVQVG
jgi:hypothetical protein